MTQIIAFFCAHDLGSHFCFCFPFLLNSCMTRYVKNVIIDHIFSFFFFYIYTLFFFLRGYCLVSFCEKATLVFLKNKINKTYTHPLSHSSPYRQANSQHPTSKNLFTQQTKILLFLLLIISLTQHNHLYLHFDTRSQNNKTQATMSDFVFFFLRERHSLFLLFINRI